MLDTRLHGRDLQAAFKTGQSELPTNDPTISDGTRTLLGFEQEEWLVRQLWAQLSGQLRFVSLHMKYINLNRRGYAVLALTHEMATGEIYHVDSVDAKSDRETLAKVMVSEVNNNLVRGEGEKTPRL